MLIFKHLIVSTHNSVKNIPLLINVVAILAISVMLNACEKQSDAPRNPTLETIDSTQTRPTLSAQEQKLTITLLEEKGATKLNNNEIYSLIIDNSIVFEHLGTGEYFEAIYKKDGRRLLTNVDSGSLDDETLHDAYLIKDDKLQTKFKGKPIASVIYKLDNRYLAAIDSDNGVVNYEIRDIVKAPMTVAVLKSQNAKILSSEEISQLFVGNKILIKDLLTGDDYIGIYNIDGTRSLQYINPLKNTDKDSEMITSDSYKIHNNQLFSTVDGNEIVSTIFEMDSHYYGALSVDDGAVNYEFIPQ